jgi:hypothetical protein
MSLNYSFWIAGKTFADKEKDKHGKSVKGSCKGAVSCERGHFQSLRYIGLELGVRFGSINFFWLFRAASQHPHRRQRVPDRPAKEGIMHPKARFLFTADMDVDPDKEALFNEVYDTEHVPNLLKVPGVHAVARMEGEPFAMSIGGEQRMVVHDGPRHRAIYEIDGPHVLVSREWAKAVEAGRWPTEVRPFTRNRQHALYKLR